MVLQIYNNNLFSFAYKNALTKNSQFPPGMVTPGANHKSSRILPPHGGTILANTDMYL
jgi:hypothetical protein